MRGAAVKSTAAAGKETVEVVRRRSMGRGQTSIDAQVRIARGRQTHWTRRRRGRVRCERRNLRVAGAFTRHSRRSRGDGRGRCDQPRTVLRAHVDGGIGWQHAIAQRLELARIVTRKKDVVPLERKSFGSRHHRPGDGGKRPRARCSRRHRMRRDFRPGGPRASAFRSPLKITASTGTWFRPPRALR